MKSLIFLGFFLAASLSAQANDDASDKLSPWLGKVNGEILLNVVTNVCPKSPLLSMTLPADIDSVYRQELEDYSLRPKGPTFLDHILGSLEDGKQSIQDIVVAYYLNEKHEGKSLPRQTYICTVLAQMGAAEEYGVSVALDEEGVKSYLSAIALYLQLKGHKLYK